MKTTIKFTLRPLEKDVVRRYLEHMLQEFKDEGETIMRIHDDYMNLQDEQIKWLAIGRTDAIETMLHRLDFIKTPEYVIEELINDGRLFNE